MEVPGVRILEEGLEELGLDLDVQVVDVGVQALSAITPLAFVPGTDEAGIIGFGEDLDTILGPQLLMQYAKEWIGQQALQRVTSYSTKSQRPPRRSSPLQC